MIQANTLSSRLPKCRKYLLRYDIDRGGVLVKHAQCILVEIKNKNRLECYMHLSIRVTVSRLSREKHIY